MDHSSRSRQLDDGGSELRGPIEHYLADLSLLDRRYGIPLSKLHLDQMSSCLRAWKEELSEIKHAGLSDVATWDLALLSRNIDQRLRRNEEALGTYARLHGALPYASTITALEERRRAMQPVQPREAAGALAKVKAMIECSGPADEPGTVRRAARESERLSDTLKSWFDFYAEYDPEFVWWVREPYDSAIAAMRDHREVLRQLDASAGSIGGIPIGREAVLAELRDEWIVATPEELIAAAEEEYAWCLNQIQSAARELGFGDDWRSALQHVKNLHESPGRQPELVAELAWEALDLLRDQDLMTVPQLARESWRMEMMSADRQKTSPFFLGGETIIVSFPTDGMDHEAKLASLQANNRSFARATVHHELFPGHGMQSFMNARYKPYRRALGTPFWVEGWALYWEMLLWNRGFQRGPEDVVGMMFWRMHRCVRVSFSLRFHMGETSAEECVETLVDRVGHSRETAEGEVRRSFGGDYPPLYQAAYLIGALQFTALRKELVDRGGMPEREFHDRAIRENNVPLEMLRGLLHGERHPNARQPLPIQAAKGW